MLQSFLRRCADHPDLKQSEVFRKFLDGRWSWVSNAIIEARWESRCLDLTSCPLNSNSTRSLPPLPSLPYRSPTSRLLQLILRISTLLPHTHPSRYLRPLATSLETPASASSTRKPSRHASRTTCLDLSKRPTGV